MSGANSGATVTQLDRVVSIGCWCPFGDVTGPWPLYALQDVLRRQLDGSINGLESCGWLAMEGLPWKSRPGSSISASCIQYGQANVDVRAPGSNL